MSLRSAVPPGDERHTRKRRRRVLAVALSASAVSAALWMPPSVSAQTPVPNMSTEPVFVQVPYGYSNFGQPGWMRFDPGDDMSCAASHGAHACVPQADRPSQARVERWTNSGGEHCQRRIDERGNISADYCWQPTPQP